MNKKNVTWTPLLLSVVENKRREGVSVKRIARALDVSPNCVVVARQRAVYKILAEVDAIMRVSALEGAGNKIGPHG